MSRFFVEHANTAEHFAEHFARYCPENRIRSSLRFSSSSSNVGTESHEHPPAQKVASPKTNSVQWTLVLGANDPQSKLHRFKRMPHILKNIVRLVQYFTVGEWDPRLIAGVSVPVRGSTSVIESSFQIYATVVSSYLRICALVSSS